MYKINKEIISKFVKNFEFEASTLYSRETQIDEHIHDSVSMIEDFINGNISASTLFEYAYFVLYECLGSKKYSENIKLLDNMNDNEQYEYTIDLLQKYKFIYIN